MLDVAKRDDMFDPRMLVLRVASAAAVYYGATEFLKDPQQLEDILATYSDVSGDVFEWGQNKFLGIPDNSTAI